MKDKKRKVREATESWMNIPISFPTISLEDMSEEPLIVEAKVEGYIGQASDVKPIRTCRVAGEGNYQSHGEIELEVDVSVMEGLDF
ncbi:hypothetical protein Tco_1033327 [Tanacetum coccineum]|uniref:Uncharacterized protein n=1 Tax=Tanacetum coccineum TaxID=301880 RepID=A0ABQ5GED8_9ASTR